MAVVDAEQVVEHEHLAVGRGTAPMPITGIVSSGMSAAATAAGIASNTIEKQPACLQRERVAGEPERPLGGAALSAIAAERGRGLRREADVAHHRDAGVDDRAGTLDAGAAALELDGVAACLLDEPLRGRDRLLVGGLVGAERQVADQQRRRQAARTAAASISISSVETGTVEG